jgi:hypothetical protein
MNGLKAMAPVVEVRGKGLMIGAVLDKPIARDAVRECFERRLIVNATDEHTLRLVPPLVLTEAQAVQALQTLADVLGVPAPKVEFTARTTSSPLTASPIRNWTSYFPSRPIASNADALPRRLSSRSKTEPSPSCSRSSP